MSQAAHSCPPDMAGRCVTCADEVLEAHVQYVDQMAGLAVVVIDGSETEIDISLMDEVVVGDVLLIHGGVALNHRRHGDER